MRKQNWADFEQLFLERELRNYFIFKSSRTFHTEGNIRHSLSDKHRILKAFDIRGDQSQISVANSIRRSKQYVPNIICRQH